MLNNTHVNILTIMAVIINIFYVGHRETLSCCNISAYDTFDAALSYCP